MNTKWLAMLGILGLILGGVWLAHAQEATDQEKKTQLKNQLMKRKLESAQKVLEGAAMLHFATVERFAGDLIQVSNTAEWQVVPTPEYKRHSEEFRRNCDELRKAAKNKNGDGVAIAYVKMSMNCFDCHKYIREVKITLDDQGDRPHKGLFARLLRYQEP